MKRNPKQDGSNLYDCKPQVGLCPNNCNQCFYNRPGAFYININEPIFPDLKEMNYDDQDAIVRVNCGHDSNIQKSMVIETTKDYYRKFYNTSIPNFDFPEPVVFTANPKEEKPVYCGLAPHNLMFVRLRVSSTNLKYIKFAISYYTTIKVPVVLTFMAYYDQKPDCINHYKWKKRHINSYWCPTDNFMYNVLHEMKEIGGNLVTICTGLCRNCRNCETYYWQTKKRLRDATKGI